MNDPADALSIRYLDAPLSDFDATVAMRPDGAELALCGKDERVSLFDLNGSAEPVVIVSAAPTRALAYSPRGELFASGHRLDRDKGAWRRVFASKNYGVAVWLCDGRVVFDAGYAGYAGGTVHASEEDGGRSQARIERKDLGDRDSTLVAAPDVPLVAFGGQYAQVYDVEAGKYRKRLPRKKMHHGVCVMWSDAGLFCADEAPIAGPPTARVTRFGRKGKTQFPALASYDIPGEKVVHGIAARGDRLLVVLAHYTGAEPELRLFSIQHGTQLASAHLALELGRVVRLCIDARGDRAALCGKGKLAVIELAR